MEAKEEKIGTRKYVDYEWHTVNGLTKRKRVSVKWFLDTFREEDEAGKAESTEAMRDFIMGYAMTEGEYAKFYPEREHEEPIYGTLNIMENTLKRIDFNIRTCEIMLKPPKAGVTLDKLAVKNREQNAREKEGYDVVRTMLKERIRILKREIRKLEKGKLKMQCNG